MPQQSFYCSHCKYMTDHKAKYSRHLDTLKHQIAVDGILCCGLQYFDKHRWVNHKKSVKHNVNKNKISQSLMKALNISSSETPTEPDHELPIEPDHELPIEPDHELPIEPDHELPVEPEIPTESDHELPVEPELLTESQITEIGLVNDQTERLKPKNKKKQRKKKRRHKRN